MGYAISVPIRNKVKRQKVLAWVNANMTPWTKLSGDPDTYNLEMVEYARKGTIGFHYTAGSYETYNLVWGICCWLATKAGDHLGDMPWVDYDKCDKIKIKISAIYAERTDPEFIHVNESGIQWSLLKPPAGLRKIHWMLDRKNRKIFVNEIQRLNNLWDKEPPV